MEVGTGYVFIVPKVKITPINAAGEPYDFTSEIVEEEELYSKRDLEKLVMAARKKRNYYLQQYHEKKRAREAQQQVSPSPQNKAQAESKTTAPPQRRK
jgi:hypothetical protein